MGPDDRVRAGDVEAVLPGLVADPAAAKQIDVVGLVSYSVYNGYWYWRRPSPAQLRADLCAVTEKARPDWDITAPGQQDAWGRGDKSAFWPYGMSLREVFAADPSA
jgi:hypothetical protein